MKHKLAIIAFAIAIFIPYLGAIASVTNYVDTAILKEKIVVDLMTLNNVYHRGITGMVNGFENSVALTSVENQEIVFGERIPTVTVLKVRCKFDIPFRSGCQSPLETTYYFIETGTRYYTLCGGFSSELLIWASELKMDKSMKQEILKGTFAKCNFFSKSQKRTFISLLKNPSNAFPRKFNIPCEILKQYYINNKKNEYLANGIILIPEVNQKLIH